MTQGFRLVDLSMPIESLKTPVFPGYPQPLKAVFTTIATHGYNSNVWVLAEHTSTHVDAPLHFVEGGPSIDSVPIKTYVAWATAVDLTDLPPQHVISEEELRSKVESLPLKVGDGWALLLNTGYSDKAGTEDWFKHPVLSEEACDYILELGVKAIGVDAPSPDGPPFPAHKKLLPKGVAIYENLTNLHLLIGRKFLFVGLPLKLVGATATPVRAVAIVFET